MGKNSRVDKTSKSNIGLKGCVCFQVGGGRGCFFVFVSMVLRVGVRVEGFFHSSQNEEICRDLVGLMHFTKIPLCMHFIKISKLNIT